LWGDEAISVNEASLNFSAMIQQLRTHDVHPPLYFSILWADIRLFGAGPLAVRIPSIVAGTLIVPMVYLAAKACLDRRAGYIACLLATVAPLMVWYSQEARMYSQFMLFALVTLWAQIRCLQDGRWRYWALLTLGAVALIYTQYFGALQLGSQAVAFGVFMWTRRGTPAGRRLLRRCFLSAAGVVILVVPLLPYVHQQFFRTNTGLVRGGDKGTSIYSVFALINSSLWGYHSTPDIADLNALWPVIMLVVLLVLGRRLDYSVRLIAFCIAMPIAILYIASLHDSSLFDVRYAAGVVPLLVVLVSVFISRTARRRLTICATTGLLLAASLVGLADQQYDSSNPKLFDYQHTVRWITQRYQPGEVVEFSPEGQKAVIHYYGPKFPYLIEIGPTGKASVIHYFGPHPLSASSATSEATLIFLIVAPPLYGSANKEEYAAINEVGRGRKMIAHYDGDNVKVLEFQ
jgi:uncharacterized membrane protein